MAPEPEHAEWYGRFPQWQDRLRRLFRVHALIRDSGTVPHLSGPPTFVTPGPGAGAGVPEAERLSAEELVDDVNRTGPRARYIPDVDSIVATIVAEHRPGDVVVLMSNGGFGGIHGRLVQALQR